MAPVWGQITAIKLCMVLGGGTIITRLAKDIHTCDGGCVIKMEIMTISRSLSTEETKKERATNFMSFVLFLIAILCVR